MSQLETTFNYENEFEGETESETESENKNYYEKPFYNEFEKLYFKNLSEFEAKEKNYENDYIKKRSK